MKTECGIFAIFTNPRKNFLDDNRNDDLKKLIYNGMVNIQHRGQDGYGYIIINSSDKDNIYSRQSGLLPSSYESIFPDNVQLGNIFLAHLRYSTNTTTEINNNLYSNNGQPLEISKINCIYIAHNGNIPNTDINLPKIGLARLDKGLSDTYIFKNIWEKLYFNNNKITLEDVIEYIKWILNNIIGAYSCVLTYYNNCNNGNCDSNNESLMSSIISNISDNLDRPYNLDNLDNSYNISSEFYYLIGFRDRYGYKPLSICEVEGKYCFVSETVQLKGYKYKFIRDVMPGEIWICKNNEEPYLISRLLDENLKNKTITNLDNLDNLDAYICSMEIIYFMKKESRIFNGLITVHHFRQRLGLELGKQDLQYSKGMNGWVITYIPESSKSIAEGYSDILNIPINHNLILKVENIRSFIENCNESRVGKIKRKFAFNIEDIKKIQEIVLVDDSIVRGNTMRYIIQIIKEINPFIKIHIRIGCPKLLKGCNFGIDIYDDELIVPKINEQRESGITLDMYFGVDSIMFLEKERLDNIFRDYGMANCGWCYGSKDNINIQTLEW